jgi:dTDP-4-dehydrorhamnose 3,5-epimerase
MLFDVGAPRVMKFREAGLAGAWIVEPERFKDERGWFARVRCGEEFAAHGLEPRFVQTSLSFSRYRGVLRGMHFQAPPREEVKLVRCVRGAVYDVIIDLRPDSPTFLEHFAVQLNSHEGLALYVPKGCAHGFQALEDRSEVLYEISEFYSPDHSRGVRWNDPAFAVEWPVPDPIMLERDRSYPDFRPEPAE